MPKIVPSQVVALLGASFNLPDPDLKPGFEAAPSVRAVVDLASMIEEEHFSGLSQENYLAFQVARSIAAEIVERWRNLSIDERRVTGSPRLESSQALQGRHPLRVLRDVLSACPDTAPASTTPGLPFLGDPALAEVIRQDMSTASSALANGEYKAACVMAGSVVEALLLWAVQRKAQGIPAAVAACQQAGEQTHASPDPERWDLQHLLNVGKRLPVISQETFDSADSAREFRNLIHPGRAQRLKISPTRARATLTVGSMLQVVDDLSIRVSQGAL